MPLSRPVLLLLAILALGAGWWAGRRLDRTVRRRRRTGTGRLRREARRRIVRWVRGHEDR